MSDEPITIEAAREALNSAYADMSTKREAHVAANTAAWQAYSDYQAAVAHKDAMQVQLDAVMAEKTEENAPTIIER